jgi:hypothetical protein
MSADHPGFQHCRLLPQTLRLNPGDGIAIGQLGRRANGSPSPWRAGALEERGSGNSARR